MPPDDERRLVELYEAHGPSLWRFVVHLTGNPTQAEDIVQDTLLRAWRSPQDRPRARPPGWRRRRRAPRG